MTSLFAEIEGFEPILYVVLYQLLTSFSILW